MKATLEHAKILDQQDPLKKFRTEFQFPKSESGEEILYFCGNSLGLKPKRTNKIIQEELDKWGTFGVEGHFKGSYPWMPYHEFVTAPLSQIVGAKDTEVVAMNTLTTNLHLLLVSFFRPHNKRKKIAIEKSAFPSDQYAVKSQLRFHHLNADQDLIELGESGKPTSTEDLLAQIQKHKDEIAVLLIGGVNYLTGQAFDMRTITEFAHKHGIIVGFDLAHAAGNLVLELHDWKVDFACWCSYKYLNSGPGGIAGIFVHEKHLGKKDIPRFEGWWGQNKQTRFQMGPDFDPIPTAEAWQLSNPPIFQLAALRASLEIFSLTSMKQLREKGVQLTAFLELLINELPGNTIEITTPENPNERGQQLSLKLNVDGKSFVEQLSEKNMICDFRFPNIIRAAPVPLYNSFEDVYKLATFLKAAKL